MGESPRTPPPAGATVGEEGAFLQRLLRRQTRRASRPPLPPPSQYELGTGGAGGGAAAADAGPSSVEGQGRGEGGAPPPSSPSQESHAEQQQLEKMASSCSLAWWHNELDGPPARQAQSAEPAAEHSVAPHAPTSSGSASEDPASGVAAASAPGGAQVQFESGSPSGAPPCMELGAVPAMAQLFPPPMTSSLDASRGAASMAGGQRREGAAMEGAATPDESEAAERREEGE